MKIRNDLRIVKLNCHAVILQPCNKIITHLNLESAKQFPIFQFRYIRNII